MKHIWLLSLLSLTLLNADELSYGAPDATTSDAYVIQLLSTKSKSGAQATIKKVPQKYQSDIKILQSNGFYGVQYTAIADATHLDVILNDFKTAGFNSPLVLKTKMSATVPSEKTSPSSLQASKLNMDIPAQKLSQHDQTRLMVDAQNAYNQHDYSQATIYYEMMVASGIQDRQILLNLCYLYGREGSSVMMEKLIKGKRGLNDYLYAYGVGALEAGRSDLYTVLSPYLAYDKSGRLAMLCGYFFEQEKNAQRAAAFYKMAYETSPNNPYILYAYARSADISGEKEQALTLYVQLAQLGSEFEPLRFSAQSRIQALRGVQ
jgi:tetratricopeptide (TPR) repeat protein